MYSWLVETYSTFYSGDWAEEAHFLFMSRKRFNYLDIIHVTLKIHERKVINYDQ